MIEKKRSWGLCRAQGLGYGPSLFPQFVVAIGRRRLRFLNSEDIGDLIVGARIFREDDMISITLPNFMSFESTMKHESQRLMFLERESFEGRHTVGSLPTSVVTPAVSDTVLLSTFRYTHCDTDASEKVQLRQAYSRIFFSRFSRGYNMLEL